MSAKKDDTTPDPNIQPPLEGGGESLGTLGKIMPRPIVAEMEESYLSYAMSVIVARALPDARDGLKPVHRRILFAMHELGLRSGSKYKKSAAVVGDVMGKYHPHGDAPIYEAMVRMAQEFSMRYTLVDGQGNFGSIDGDSAAAMRYTEARMDKVTEHVLADIEKDTVDFAPNYDEFRKEPTVLPSRIPNLLLNGTVGIAVGMATNIPPHNLEEIIDATLHLIDNESATVEDLLQFIQGPDFPTAGIVYNKEAIRQAYLTGRGSVIIRGKAEIEEVKEGRYHIRISEIPYQVNKSTMIEKMATLVTDKIIQGISDIRDESDRDGIRIIIELKKDAYPQKILNQLFKHTDLQTSFGYNMIALADGLQPRLMNVQELLQIFVGHRRVVVRRRIIFDRDRAKERAHILEGLKKALDHIDAVIATIRKSETKEIAKVNLIDKFKFTEIQADAILQMRLQTLAGLERKKIEDELKEKLDFIAECEALLASQKKMDAVIKGELTGIRAAFGDGRRTAVVKHAVGEFSAKDTIPNAPMMVTLTRGGYVKRLSPIQFRAQHRGGKGIIGMTTKDDDEVLSMLHVMNHDDMLFFTNTGRVFKLPTYEVPQAGRTAKGQAIVNLLQLQPGERITAILKADLKDKKHLFMTTQKGTVKRSDLSEFENIRRSGLIAQKLPPGDELKWVLSTSGKDEVYILSRKGKAIRFKEDDVRSMGRAAAGVHGIHLAPGDEVVEAALITDPAKSKLLVVMENGLGKMTSVGEYRLQGRGGTGVKAAQLTPKTGDIVGGHVLTEGEEGDLLCISKQGQMIRMKLSDIPSRGRATQGVIVMRLNGGDKVATMSVMMEDKETEEAIAQAALEERVEEVEAIEDDTKAVERAAKRAAKQAAIASEMVGTAVAVKTEVKTAPPSAGLRPATTKQKAIAKSPAKASSKPVKKSVAAAKMKAKPSKKATAKKKR